MFIFKKEIFKNLTKVVLILLFVTAIALVFIMPHLAEGEDDSDKAKVIIFLEQEKNGQTNADILGIDINDSSSWNGYFYFDGDNLMSVFISNVPVHGVLHLSDCQALQYFYCVGTELTAIELFGCSSLEIVTCYNNRLTSLDVSDCPNLMWLDCSGNSLKSFYIKGCDNLEMLSCSSNLLTTLDVSGFKKLISLDCNNNLLTSLYTNNSLIYLGFSDNRLTSFDLSGYDKLENLSCSNNLLTSLNISGCTELVMFDCSNNLLTELDLANCNLLRHANVNYNPLNTATVDALKNLKLNFELKTLTYYDSDDGCTYYFFREYFKNGGETVDIKCIGKGYISMSFFSQGYNAPIIGFYLGVMPYDGYEFIELQDVEGAVFVEYYYSFIKFLFENKDMNITVAFSNFYTVTYVSNDGQGLWPGTNGVDVKAGEKFTIAENTMKAPAGKKFKDWNTLPDGTGTAYIPGEEITMPEKNLWLYAQWETLEVKTYSITYYNLKEALNSNFNSYTFGCGFTLQNPSARTGYYFAGWYDAEIDGNKITAISDEQAGDIILWARWIKNAAPVGLNNTSFDRLIYVFLFLIILFLLIRYLLKIKKKSKKDKKTNIYET